MPPKPSPKTGFKASKPVSKTNADAPAKPPPLNPGRVYSRFQSIIAKQLAARAAAPKRTKKEMLASIDAKFAAKSESSASSNATTTSAKTSSVSKHETSLATWASPVPSLPTSVTVSSVKSTNSTKKSRDPQKLSKAGKDLTTSLLDSNPRAGMFSGMSLTTPFCSSCSSLGNYRNGKCNNGGCIGVKDNSFYIKENKKQTVVDGTTSVTSSVDSNPRAGMFSGMSLTTTKCSSCSSLGSYLNGKCNKEGCVGAKESSIYIKDDKKEDCNPRAGMFSGMSLTTSKCSSCSSLGNYLNGKCNKEGCIGSKDNSVYLKEDKKETVKEKINPPKDKLMRKAALTDSKPAPRKSDSPKELPDAAAQNFLGMCTKCIKFVMNSPGSPAYEYLETLEDAKKIKKIAEIFGVLLTKRPPHVRNMVQQIETLKWQLEKVAQFTATKAEKQYRIRTKSH